jgi:hypothetical protein
MESVTMESIVFGYCESGFFSNCNIILMNIINFFNKNKKLPKQIITDKMFHIYKSHSQQDIYNLVFDNNDNYNNISYKKEIRFNEEGYENQFSDYKLLNLSDIQPFFQKYFMPNRIILDNVDMLLNKYNINIHDDICGVFFRGNDKIKETQKPPYNEFIEKAKQLKESNSNIKFIIQTDELEFLNSFLVQFPDTIFFEEIPAISNTYNTNISRILHNDIKTRHVIDFVSIIYIFSKFKYLITTSGNCEIFITFYRNNTENLFQYLKKNKYIHGGLNKDYNEVNNVWY